MSESSPVKVYNNYTFYNVIIVEVTQISKISVKILANQTSRVIQTFPMGENSLLRDSYFI